MSADQNNTEDEDMMQLEPNSQQPDLRTGVIICNCGGEISGKIDTQLLQQRVADMPGVVYTACDSFPCNRDGRSRIQQAVREHSLDRVLVAGCTPRTVEKLFKQTARAAGLNANCIGVADIREQCAYVHNEKNEVFEKATDLVAMGIGRLQAVHVAHSMTTEITQRVLVVGAGLEALTLSRSITRMGTPVIWISDRSEETAVIYPLVGEANNLLIEQVQLLQGTNLFAPCLETRIIDLEGHPGNYQVTLLQGQKKRQVEVGAIVLVTPGLEDHQLRSLATFLNLPFREDGNIEPPRRRLRPERYHGDGIFVLTNTHPRTDTSAALFQVYQTAARVAHFMADKHFSVEAPVSVVDPDLCTGCGNCVQHCPVEAIDLHKRDGVLSLAEVDPFLCVGCGNCVVACPVHAISIPGLEDEAILAQINAILSLENERQPGGEMKIIAFACEWGAYAAADIAGKHHLPYTPDVRLIRMNCSARFDPMHVLWAFLNGADGVVLGACPPGECHYSESNMRARERVRLLQQQLAERGIDPRRLHLAFLPGDDGAGFVEEINAFASTLKEKVF